MVFLGSLVYSARSHSSHKGTFICEWMPHMFVCVWGGVDDDYLIHDSVSYSAMLLIYLSLWLFSCCSVQFSSVTQSCPTLCDPMNCSTPGLPVRHQLLEFTQTHVHQVGDAIQPSHPLSSPSPPAPNPSQHQSCCTEVQIVIYVSLHVETGTKGVEYANYQ